TRWPTHCAGAGPTSAPRWATCWRGSRRRAAESSCCSTPPAPTAPRRCWSASASRRPNPPPTPRRPAVARWSSGGATAPARRSWPTSASASCACSAPRGARSASPATASKWWNTFPCRSGACAATCGSRHGGEPFPGRGASAAPTVNMASHPHPPTAMPHYEGDLRAPAGARFAILASRWNPRITDALVAGARKAFADHGVEADALDVVRVPGAWELPQAALHLAASGEYAALVALGCVVRGDTRHYEQVADGCAEGLMKVALETGVPVCNGVLAVEDHA